LVQVTATASSAKIQITGDITAPGHIVILNSDGTIQAGTIDNNGAQGSHDIRLFPNQGGGSDQFVVGTSGTNGVTALHSGFVGSGWPNVTIKNGGSGGIKVDGSAIDVLSTGGSGDKSGDIVLDAGDGPITLKGHLNADAPSGGIGGIIILKGDSISTTDGAQITANDAGSAQVHYISIAANSIDYTGGLTVSATGEGGAILFAPKGSQPVTIPTDPTSLVEAGSADPQQHGLTVNSTDGGTLAVETEGPNSGVFMNGTALDFTGGPVNITAPKANVQISYVGGPTNATSLNFGGGAVTIDTSTTDSGATAGNITINADVIDTPASTVSLIATGAGNGGQINVTATNGTLPLGTASGTINMVANGGSADGNGGLVFIQAHDITAADTSNAVQAQPTGTNGSGGLIFVFGSSLTFDGSSSSLSTNGVGTGDGGFIWLNSLSSLSIGTGSAGDVALSANSTGGNGGTIEVDSFDGLTVDSANLDVSSGTEGNGGSITLKANGAALALSGNLDATGGSTNGNGGLIAIDAGSITLPSAANTALVADGNGTGSGGEVTVATHSGGVTISSADAALAIEAKSNDSGNGGLVIITSDTDITATGGAIDVSAGPSGDGIGGATFVIGANITLHDTFKANGAGAGPGGSITVFSTATLDVSDAIFNALGGNTGDGGAVSLSSAASLTVDTAQISVSPGTVTGSNGKGGTINVQGTADVTATGTFDASGQGTGAGGTITVNGATLDVSAAVFNALGGDTGNGGTVNLTSAGSLTIDTAQISVNPGTGTGSNGNGGTINVQGGGDVTATGAFNASGQGNGVGGSISLTAGTSSTLTLTGTSTANGGSGDANGGFILLSAGGFTLPAGANTALTTDGNGAGNGGEIILITFANGITISADNAALALEAKSNGSGNGGTVDVASNSTVALSGASVNVSAGSSGDGNGGTINVTGDQITLSDEIDANGEGSGTGGNIDFTITGATPMDASSAIFNAHGGDSGEGGTVSISNVSNFPVDSDVTDDADNDATNVSSGTFDGIIDLNDPPCQKNGLGRSTWPYSYFNCVNVRPNSPSTTDAYPSSIIISNLSGAISAATNISRIKLYVFNNIDDVNKYFNLSTSLPLATGFGDTREDTAATTNINVAVVENSPDAPSGGTLSEFNLKEVTIHEMGHALDHLIGQLNQSASSSYNAFVQNDFLLLDYVGGVVSGTTIRPACTASSDGGPAPFANVSAVCTGTTENSTYSTMLNSAILRTLSTGVFHQHTPPGLGVLAWNELYAQALAVKAYLLLNSISNSDYLYTRTTDWVLTSGYFSCTLAWADAVRTGNVNSGHFTPSLTPTENYSSTSCSTALPGGYTAITE
jgi:hypothetical protein